MGMLINGKWDNDANRSMIGGTYRRESSTLSSNIDAGVLRSLQSETNRFILVASASCPWSHGAVITLILTGLAKDISVQWAGGPRIEGYGMLPDGPITQSQKWRHVHELYSQTDPNYTGRSTVPVLWDSSTHVIISSSSTDIIQAFDKAGKMTNFRPEGLAPEIDALTEEIFDGLSNAVYRAGKAEQQDEYNDAVKTVFETMDRLEERLIRQEFLFGGELTTADIRLFATLVRFDCVYATHFRCTLRRLVDYPALWRFTRRIYQMPGIKQTVDFDQIRFGYYVNDGSHNPFNIIGQQPYIDWESQEGIEQ